MNTEISTFKYQTGGSLSATDPTYVQRQADQDLYNFLKEGEFCYVLNSRQMGKSSLRVRTMQRLQQDGYACAEVDLSGIGSKLSEEKWYNGLVHRLMRSFTIPSEVNWRSWWKEHSYLPPVQRLGELFEEILLPSVSQDIVIFLDEIDSVLSFDFPTDDFFAQIRYYYNQRVNNPNYNRLRFCLLGVATPSELIQDKKRTPFNIGRGVELTGLTEEEAIPVLSQGLASVVEYPEQLLTEVLYWTGGQPFLTQKLCRLIVENSTSILLHGNIAEGFARFVRSQIIENWESKDQPEHLKTIRDRVINRSEQRTSHLLELYQRIWQNGEVKAQSNPEESELKLSGLVVNRQCKINVYNPIYREVFNQNWIDEEIQKIYPYVDRFKAWVISNFKESSQLLKAQEINEVMVWANQYNPSYEYCRFIFASYQIFMDTQKKFISRFLDINTTNNDYNVYYNSLSENVTRQEKIEEQEKEYDDTVEDKTQTNSSNNFSSFLAPLTQETFIEVVQDVEDKLKTVNQTLSMLDNLLDAQGFKAVLQEMLWSITLKMGELLSADRTIIWLLDDNKDELWSIVAKGEDGKPLELRIPVSAGIAGEAATSKQVVNIPYDFYDDPRSTAARKSDSRTGYRTYTILAMPLLNEEQEVVAVVQLLNKFKLDCDPNASLAQKIDERGFTAEDEKLFEEFAPSIRLILESSKSFDAATQRHRAATALMKAVDSLNKDNLDLTATLNNIMGQAKELINADRCTFWLLNTREGELWIKIPVQGKLTKLSVPATAGFLGMVAQTGEPLLIPFDLYNDPRSVTAKKADQKTGYRTCTLLCMPVYNANNQLIGVTQFVNKNRPGKYPRYNPDNWPEAPERWQASFNRNDLEFIKLFNTLVAIALQNFEGFQKVKELEQWQRDILRQFNT